MAKNRSGQHRWKTDAATEQLIRELARVLPDRSIASVLNRLGVRSAKGHTWTQLRIRCFRNEHGVPVYREGERFDRGELILHEAATRLGVSKMTCIGLDLIGQVSDLGVVLRASDRSDQQATATGWLC